MPDLKKVMEALEHCTSFLGCHECPYSDNGDATISCKVDIDRDALELLKAREPVSPKKSKMTKPASETAVNFIELNFCGQCGEIINIFTKYCPNCGRPVKWE